MDDLAKYKKISNKILNLPNNVLVEDIELYDNNESFKILETYEIQNPELRPKPSSLLSEWPPNNKLWFYHSYFHTSIPFLTVGDHIAEIDIENKNRVVLLSRLILLKKLLNFFCFEYLDIVNFFLDTNIIGLKKKTNFINIDDVKKFFDNKNSYSEWKIKLTKHTNKVRAVEKAHLEKKLQKKYDNRDAQLQAVINNFNRKFDENVAKIKNEINKL
jgi:sulfur relay (sulfurtransferase) DsrF/TusC family protein